MSIRSLFVLALSVFGVLVVTAAQAQDPRYGGGPGYDAASGGVVECRSSDYAFQRCAVPWRDARIVRQLSNTQCVRGQNWGFDRHGLWVDHGCAGRFVDARGGYRGDYDDDRHGGYRGDYDDDRRGGYQGGWQPGPGWNQRFTVRCESYSGQSNYCAVDVGGRGRVYLQRQESNSPCREGYSWGWNRGGVWVAQGCRGTFTVDRRW